MEHEKEAEHEQKTEHYEVKKTDAPKRWERKEMLVAVLIGVLVLTAGIQTIQLVGLTSAEVVVSASGGAPLAGQAAASGGSAPAVPTNLQNLPSMVGGC